MIIRINGQRVDERAWEEYLPIEILKDDRFEESFKRFLAVSKKYGLSNYDRFIGHLQKHNKAYYLALAFFFALVLGDHQTVHASISTASTAVDPNVAASAGTATAQYRAQQAATTTHSTGGMTLILLLQKGSFWLGMAVSIWGIVEAQLDAPGWKGRILKGVLGYIGILLIPLVFLELQNNLGVSTWRQMQEQDGTVGGVLR